MKKFIARVLGLYTDCEMVNFAEYMMREDKAPRGEAFQGTVSHAKFSNWKEALHVA